MLPGVLILANYYQVLILKVHFISYLPTRRLWFVVVFHRLVVSVPSFSRT